MDLQRGTDYRKWYNINRIWKLECSIMSKITVTELQGHTSGGDANKVKIKTGHELEVVDGATTLGGNVTISDDFKFTTNTKIRYWYINTK